MVTSVSPGRSKILPDVASVEYSVVIPVYQSAQSLAALYERLRTVMEEISPNYEIIFVDDASPDDAWTLIEQFRSEDSRVKGIQHMRNFGQQLAILSGLRHVRGQYVITMDDDLQHPPEEIPKLVDAITRHEHVDAAIGAYETKHHFWFRNVGSSVLNRITSFIFRVDPSLQLTSFRIIRRVVVDEMLEINAQCTRISHLLLMTTNRLMNVPVSHCPREHGRSGYSPGRLVSNALDTILTNSALPLQFMSLIGFGSSFVSFLVALFYLGRYLFVGISVPVDQHDPGAAFHGRCSLVLLRCRGGVSDTDSARVARCSALRHPEERTLTAGRLFAKGRIMHAFIVGCQRGGTTYLAEMLDQHPEIRMVRPLQPEPKFFLSPENCRRGPDYYHELYGPPGDKAVVCEKTSSYMEYDYIPQRIKSCFPDGRILLMLRSPVERAISHYFYSVQNGLERRPIEEGLFGPEPSTKPANISMSPFRYVPRSRYVRSTSDYLSCFPHAKVLITESIVGNPDGIRQVYEYLGVDAAFVPGNPSQKVNAGLLTPEVPEAIRRRLADLLMPQVDELEKLISADLRSWWA